MSLAIQGASDVLVGVWMWKKKRKKRKKAVVPAELRKRFVGLQCSAVAEMWREVID